MNSWFPRTTGGYNTWATGDYVYVDDSIVLTLTEGEYGDVEIEIPVDLVPALAVSSVVGTGKVSSDTVRATLTVARGALVKTGTLSAANAVTVRPVLSVTSAVVERYKTSTDTATAVLSETSVLTARGLVSTESIVPILTASNSVDTGFVEKLSADTLTLVVSESSSIFEPLPQRFTTESIVPVLGVASVVTDLFMDKASAVTLTPTLAYVIDIEQTAGLVQWTLAEVASVTLTVSSVVSDQTGEVDAISISASAAGNIEFRYV